MRFRTVALLALLSCLVSADARAAETRRARDLPVVRTWGELFDVEPVEVGGQKVRLGVEAEAFPAGGGVLAYCLMDQAPARPKGADVETVGPVSLHVAIGCSEKQLFQRTMSQMPRITGPRVYVGIVSAGSSGPLRVTIRPDGWRDGQDEAPPLASRELTVTRERYHGWTRLLPVPRDTAAAGPDVGPDDGVRALRVTPTVCVPHRDGLQPFAFDAGDWKWEVHHKRTDALPRLFPDEADRGLRLTFDGRTATVESDMAFPSAHPEEGLLVRWWVNGKPVLSTPQSQNQPVIQLRQMRQREQGSRTLRLRLEWDPADIGAKPDDSVRAQLLFCPTGVRPLSQPGIIEGMAIPATGEAEYVARMSGTAEFVVR
jgi:hypothetical protein